MIAEMTPRIARNMIPAREITRGNHVGPCCCFNEAAII